MTISAEYTPQEMLAMMEQNPVRTTFFWDMVVGNRIEVHDTPNLKIDVVKGGMTISPYVARTGGPNPVDKEVFETLTHVTPYNYDNSVFTPKDLDHRNQGQTVYSQSAAQNMDFKIGRQLQLMRKRFQGRREQQIAEALQTGQVNVQGKGVNYVVNFQRDASLAVTLAGADLWDSGTQKIEKNFSDWAAAIDDLGATGTGWCVMGRLSAQAFLADDAVLKKLDYRRVEQGDINIRLLRQQRATYIGTFRSEGVDIDIYSYSGFYYNGTTNVRFMDEKKIVMGSSDAYTGFHYGRIDNFKVGNFAVEEFPLVLEADNGKTKELTLESSPLFGMHEPDAFLVATVLV
jgi:hypothetical protein